MITGAFLASGGLILGSSVTSNAQLATCLSLAAFPGHSLQAPCLRFMSPSLGAVTTAGGMGVHPFRIQVDAGELSAGNIELRWTIIVPAIRTGEQEETYPVPECRNKMSCGVYVPSNAYHYGNPVVIVTGSYQRTPWIKTTLRVSLQKQGEEEASLVLPQQILQYQATQRQISQKPSHKALNRSSQNEAGPSDSHNNTLRREFVDPRNSLVPQETLVPQIPRVRHVRRGRNKPTSPHEVRTSSTLPRRGGRELKGRTSSNNWQQGGENTVERRGRPHGKTTAVSKNTRRIGRKDLVVSRPVRGLPFSPRQSPRQFSKRRDSRQVNRATAYGHQSPRRQSHGAVRQYGGQYPIQHPPPSVNDYYQQRIQSEVNALQRLRSSWQLQEEQQHEKQEQKKSTKQHGAHKGRLLEEKQDLRADHLSRLNRYSSGESNPRGSLSPIPGRKRLTETERKPSRIIPNYYPIIPHRQVEQEHRTTAPTATTTTAPNEKTTTTTNGEPVSSEIFPETSQYHEYEESQVRLSEGGTDSRNNIGMVSIDEPQIKIPGRGNSPDAVDIFNSRESWWEYSDLLPAYMKENTQPENTFNNEDGVDEIYDTSVPMDTWGESKSVKRKRGRSIVDEINRRMPLEDEPMTKQLTADRYMHEPDMPLNEQTFRALREEIINEERKEPKSREDNIPSYSAESFDFRPNARQQSQYFASPNSDNELLHRSSALASAIGKRVAHVRAPRTVAEDSAFETSASEPREYSYHPSSDLSELDTATGDAMGDIHKRSLDEEKFRSLQEEILEEERVGLSQRTNGGYLSDNLPAVRNSPLRQNDHIGKITVSGRNDLLSPNNRKGSEWQQKIDGNPQEQRLTPGSFGAERRWGDYLGYDPMSNYDRVPKRIESEQWSEWSRCSHSCGHGTKTRHRACTELNKGPCSNGVESHVVICALERCSEDWEGAAVGAEESVSGWRDWSGWSACSVSCGSGLSHRQRTCLQDLGCLGQREEAQTCWLDECNNKRNGAMPEGATTRRSDHHHGHHTKRIKCHLDESRSHLPMELFWTSPTGEKITHAMAHEKNSKYHIEGTTLVVSEDKPTEGSYHCIVIYGGSSGSHSHNKVKAGPTGGCHPNPCHHNGVCLDHPGPQDVSFRCLCPAGYEGKTCHMAPYLKGDVVVLSLLGWFIVSSIVIILVICLCCSKKMKKRKLKEKLEVDDAPAEKLLAKILPHIDTLHNPDSTSDEDTKSLLGFRPPQVANKPPLKNVRPTEPMEMPKLSGKPRFKHFVKKIAESKGKKVEGFAFPTPKQVKTLNEEIISRRNQNNSNTFDSCKSEDGSLSSDTPLNSSCESLPEEVDDEEFSQLANHNMNNCSWDYSNVSSCVPCDLNTSSIVGNDDDSLLEISTENFHDFQVANAFSVFKGTPSTRRNQAVIDPSLGDEDSSSIPTCSTWLPDEVPHRSEKHPMFHFEPSSSNSMCAVNSSPEQQNHYGSGSGAVSGTSPWRNERPWLMGTPPRRGNGVRVQLPPSPLLSVSPSRLRLPPSPTGQRASRMFVPAEEHVILEQYRERMTAHPNRARSHVTYVSETSPQEALDDHPVEGDCHRNGLTSKRPSISSCHDTSGSFGPCYRDKGRLSFGTGKRQEYSIATDSDSSPDPTPTGIATVEKPSRQRLETKTCRSLFRQRVCESSGRFGNLMMPASQDMHQPFSLDKSCTTPSDYL